MLQRSIQHAFEFLVALDHHEGCLGLVAIEGGFVVLEIRRPIQELAVAHDLFVGIASAQVEEGLVALLRQALLQRVQFQIVL